MRQTTIYFLVGCVVLCAACSSHVYRQTDNITPMSYQSAQLPILRNEGKLRRLILLPIKHDYNNILWIKRTPSEEKAIKRKVQLKIQDILINWKGYEVISLDPEDSRGLERLGLSTEEMGQINNILAEWARQSADNAEPTPDVVRMISNIVRPLNVDGVFVVQGHSWRSNSMTILTILSASLAWPLMFASNDFEMRADLYEAATGRIIWRCQLKNHIKDMWEELTDSYVTDLFSGFEQAVPTALTE